jgi:hypothetical protein
MRGDRFRACEERRRATVAPAQGEDAATRGVDLINVS